MILSKTLAKDMVGQMMTVIDKVRNDKSKDNANKVALYYNILALLDTPLSELKITWIKHSLGFLNDWVLSETDFKVLRSILIRLEIVSYSRVLTQIYENFGYLYNAKDILPDIFAFKR